MFAALKLKFNEIKLQKNSECPICGVHPTIHELIDYEKFCSAPSLVVNQNTRNENQITVEELKARMEQKNNLFLLDVREIFEHQMANIGGYLIPLNELSDRVSELDLSREIIIYCQHGIRSIKAVEFLKQQGFKNVRNLVGGLDAWMEQNV
jgi:adenylyltransferase/sulfurtransferase